MRVRTLAVVALLAMPPASAETVSLSFASLPSDQGWTYASSGAGFGIPPGQLYRATGTELLQDTLGIPTTGAGHNYFFRPIAIGPGEDFSLRVSARFNQAEGVIENGTVYPFALSFGVATDEGYYYFGVGGSRIGYGTSANVSYIDFPDGHNGAAWNDFLLTRIGGTVRLHVNGVAVLSGASFPIVGAPRVLLGDGTGFANARGAYRQFEFRTGVVPEPATWAMMIAGFGLVGAALRWRNTTTATHQPVGSDLFRRGR